MTPKAMRALDFVRERIVTAGFAPTLVEIGDQIGVDSKSRVHALINQLIENGHLRRLPHRSRGLSLPDLPDLRAVPSAAIRAELARRGETLDALDDRPSGRFNATVVTCAADSCGVEVKPGMLFCRRHWFRLPYSLREDISRAFGNKDEALYELYVREARGRIDAGMRAEDARRRS